MQKLNCHSALALIACGVRDPLGGHLCLEDEALGIKCGVLLDEVLHGVRVQRGSGCLGNLSTERGESGVGDGGRSPYDDSITSYLPLSISLCISLCICICIYGVTERYIAFHFLCIALWLRFLALLAVPTNALS